MKDKARTVVLSSGVELAIETVWPTALMRIASFEVAKPEPPMIFLTDKGRSEPNELDPEYQAALRKYWFDVGQQYMNGLILLGTKVHKLPDGFDGPDDPEWAEAMNTVIPGAIPEVGSKKRYLAWVRYWACRTAEDINAIERAVTESNAVLEGAVAESMAGFPDKPQRTADLGSPAPKARRHRDKLRHTNGCDS